MEQSISTYRKNITSPFIRKAKFKVWLYYIFVLILFLVIFSLGLSLFHEKKIASLRKDSIARSSDEFISGGKRFLDYFYSLNSSTIKLDNYRALKMLLNKKLYSERMAYIQRVNLIKKISSAKMRSSIDWQRANYTIVESSKEVAKIRYKAFIDIDNKFSMPIDITLYLTATKKTDEIPDGVGVVGWNDVATNPFKGLNNE